MGSLIDELRGACQPAVDDRFAQRRVTEPPDIRLAGRFPASASQSAVHFRLACTVRPVTCQDRGGMSDLRVTLRP